MNLISCYSNPLTNNSQNLLCTNEQYSLNLQDSVTKLIITLKQKFKTHSITIFSPELNAHNQIKLPFDSLTFSLIHDSKIPQYQYCLTCDINFGTNILKLSCMILKQGKMLNIYKQGLIQIICNYSLSINGIMSNYSLRIHPITGVIKLMHINHMTQNQILQIFKYPVDFYEKIRNNVQQMVERLDQRILGKVLHLTNQISLKNIIPENFDQVAPENASEAVKKIQSTNPLYPAGTLNYLWGINNKLKQIRRQIANSTIKYSFFSKDVNRFFPEIGMRKKEIQKQQKIAKHNVKILPFSKEVKKILSYFTPTYRLIEQQCSYGNVGDTFWLEPTEQQLTYINEVLKSENFQKSGRILTEIYINQVQNEAHLCMGGFAQISRVIVKAVKKSDMLLKNGEPPKSNRLSLIKKSAAKEKLFWQKSIVQHIGKGACVFINNYYDVKADGQANGITQKMFEDCLFMDYCTQKSLNYYLGRMGPIISINTKVFLLYQVSIGLRFLRDFGVVHLDMKPENLLIKLGMGTNNKAIMILKIIDFGQAYCQTVIGGGKINRGHTCPYAPPELVKHSQTRYTQKSDVFSLGVIILYIVFQLNITDLKRLTSSFVFESNERYIKMYSICLQKCKYIGYQPLMLCLLNLAYKCLNPVITARPYLNWVCVVLKSILFVLDQIQR